MNWCYWCEAEIDVSEFMCDPCNNEELSLLQPLNAGKLWRELFG